MTATFLQVMDGINYRMSTGKEISERERVWYGRYRALLRDLKKPFAEWMKEWRDLNTEVLKGVSE